MSDTHIKINAVTPRVQYTGNGVTTTFPYEFPIFDETDMVVYVGDDIIESGYTVTGAGETEGGTVVFDTAPDDGAKITLLRNVPIERITDFQEGGTFRPKNLNDEFDRQTAFVQQVQEKLDRTLILPPTTEIDPSQVLAEVDRIYDSIDNVDAVADNETNINAVATNISDVNTCATNIAAILDAPTQATNAANSATAAAASAASLDATKIAYKNAENTFTETNTFSKTISGKTSGNLDVNASNASATGKAALAHLAMPDYSSGVSKTVTGFTADSDGWLSLTTGVISSGVPSQVTVNGSGMQYAHSSGGSIQVSDIIPIRKNDVIVGTNISTFWFYKCIGA